MDVNICWNVACDVKFASFENTKTNSENNIRKRVYLGGICLRRFLWGTIQTLLFLPMPVAAS